jgi:hypothetical protein
MKQKIIALPNFGVKLSYDDILTKLGIDWENLDTVECAYELIQMAKENGWGLPSKSLKKLLLI